MNSRRILFSPRAVRRLRGALLGLLAGLFVLSAATARAEVQFQAQVDQAQVTPGDPIHFTLILETTGAQINDLNPTTPNWGGLSVLGGPNSSDQMSYDSQSGRRMVHTLQWELSATRPGRYVIGPSQVNVGGRIYQTRPMTVVVAAAPAQTLAGSGEPILSARTDNADVNRALEGRLFLRATVSNNNPYVNEPVIIDYTLYNDQVRLSRVGQSVGNIQGILHEELFHAAAITFQTVTLKGKQYSTAHMYRMALTPSKPGPVSVEGYSMEGVLPLSQRRGSNPFGDSDQFSNFFGGAFDDPFFGGGIKVRIPSPPIQLNVRPLPSAGQPPNFSNTVGDYTLRATLDRRQGSTDDLFTLKLTLEGRGAIELASPPLFPDSKDFELTGQSAKPDKEPRSDGIGGRKVFEYVLRPKHAGGLEIPAIRYSVFNPFSAKYVTLQTEPMGVVVTPGKAPLPPPLPSAQAPGSSQPATTYHELHYIKHLREFHPLRSDRLLESMAFWLLHLAALTLLGLAWWRNRQQARMDPARNRRAGAWRLFERRLRAIRQRMAQGSDYPEAAGELDYAARAAVADRFNLSADGLTRPDIERLLLEHSVPHDRVQRLCDLIEQCAALRYAPVGAADGEFASCIDEIATLLREALQE